jgi:uncharacterized membrane protein YphA (DoxX/SURF4 family)
MGQVPTWAIITVRTSLAALWAFEGLWTKVILQDPHELGIVASATSKFGLHGQPVMFAIGGCETILAFVVVSGWKTRAVAFVQGGALLTMNLLGIAIGGGHVKEPISLMVHNLPTFASIALLASLGGEDRVSSK